MIMAKHQLNRLANKLHRLAYELEHDAKRLRISGSDYADDVKALSSRTGDLARKLHRGDQ